MSTKKKATKKRLPKGDPRNLSLDHNTVLKGGMPQALGMRVTSLTKKTAR